MEQLSDPKREVYELFIIFVLKYYSLLIYPHHLKVNSIANYSPSVENVRTKKGGCYNCLVPINFVAVL
jgi:hypothetical protein